MTKSNITSAVLFCIELRLYCDARIRTSVVLTECGLIYGLALH